MEVRAKRVIEGQESGHKQIGRWSKYLTADGLDIGGEVKADSSHIHGRRNGTAMYRYGEEQI